MRVWISKYALTNGIIEGEGERSEYKETWIRVDGFQNGMVDKVDVHTTRESAVKRAEEMRLKRIASLQKQIRKLEGMRFE